ncbi:hypothetical protein BD410DRAFT_885994 [Rickenella mellea]|uniref:Uncharacterized protein n=1 Tax=Rickenella mellea TaxID=50990 RepID=A0A4Y7PQK9_9AGAM|nr:hypothetical protein BD410DRAFT_885994 [Rickenella mellea]
MRLWVPPSLSMPTNARMRHGVEEDNGDENFLPGSGFKITLDSGFFSFARSAVQPPGYPAVFGVLAPSDAQILILYFTNVVPLSNRRYCAGVQTEARMIWRRFLETGILQLPPIDILRNEGEEPLTSVFKRSSWTAVEESLADFIDAEEVARLVINDLEDYFYDNHLEFVHDRRDLLVACVSAIPNDIRSTTIFARFFGEESRMMAQCMCAVLSALEHAGKATGTVGFNVHNNKSAVFIYGEREGGTSVEASSARPFTLEFGASMISPEETQMCPAGTMDENHPNRRYPFSRRRRRK